MQASTLTTRTTDVASVATESTMTGGMASTTSSTDLANILQQYTDVESRVDDLEFGRRDPVADDIAAAQARALHMIQAAQESVAAEQAQQAAANSNSNSQLELSENKVETEKQTVKQTADDVAQQTETEDDAGRSATQQTTQTQDAQTMDAQTTTEADADDTTNTQAPGDTGACCSNADDAPARAGTVENSKSISDLKAQVDALTAQVTKAIAPPSVEPTAMNQENSAVISQQTSSAAGSASTGTVSPATSTGSAAECNTHLNQATLTGDPNIWKEETAAKHAALAGLLTQLQPQLTPKMATDPKTLTTIRNDIADNDATHKNFKNQLAASCSEATCDVGASGSLVVTPDTPLGS